MDGRCTCGTIRYRLKDKPLFVHACHCRWCQRETGSAFVMNALIETECVEIIGTPDVIDTPSQSGRGQKISRCPNCKVAVWSNYSGAGPKFMFVRVGTLENPDACPPDIHIYTESKQPWVILSDAVPVMQQYYRRSEHWPQWAIDRATAAAAR